MPVSLWSALPAVRTLLLGCLLFPISCLDDGDARPGRDPVEERSITELQADLSAGRVSSAALVDAYLQRIEELDDSGPLLNAVIAKNPLARAQAVELDAERARGGSRGALHGIPILVKDNIETADPMPTTAGSLALQNNLTLRDAPIVARLRAAGAIVLGKANLSEWANIRSNKSISGWSAIGGLTRNPHALDRSACGSSAGSGAAVAASLSAAAIGTDTSGSIICPAAVNGVVGLKPTVGLLSRRHIVPISRSQDSPGPMGRSVADVAIMLTAMAGSDPEDPATRLADQHKRDYLAELHLDALRGKRLGVLAFLLDNDVDVTAAFKAARRVLEDAGAELVDINEAPALGAIERFQDTVILTELKADLEGYLEALPSDVPHRTLAELIAFNQQNAGAELSLFGQELFLAANGTAGLDNPRYRTVVVEAKRAAGPDGIDALLAAHRVDALVGPTSGPAWVTATNHGAGSFNSYTLLAAVAGYPQLTVPMGDVGGLPVGLSFIGTAWSEPRLLGFAHAYEQRAHARRAPTYVAVMGKSRHRWQRLQRRAMSPMGGVAALGTGLITLAFGGVFLRRRRARALSAGRSTGTG